MTFNKNTAETDFEDILKWLSAAARFTHEIFAEKLDDKIRIHRLRKSLEDARHILRPLLYEVGDFAAASTYERCPECGQVDVSTIAKAEGRQ